MRYSVTLRQEYTVEVYADSEEEAEELALDAELEEAEMEVVAIDPITEKDPA